MQQIDQEQHRKTIINNDRNKVVHRRDQRTGSDRRINIDLFK